MVTRLRRRRPRRTTTSPSRPPTWRASRPAPPTRGPRPPLVRVPPRARAQDLDPAPLRPDRDRPLLPRVRADDPRLSAGQPPMIARDVRAVRRPGRGAVPARRAVAVRRALERYGHRRLRLGRRLAERDGELAQPPRHPRVPRRSGRDRVGGHETTRRPRPPPPAVAPVARSTCPTPSRSSDPRRGSRSRTTASFARLAARPAPRYREQGRIHGRADSEVGQRWLEDAWDADAPSAATLLSALHERFGGQAQPRDPRRATARRTTTRATPRTRCSRSGSAGSALASTAIYSIDRSLFRFAAPGATDRRLVRPSTTVDARRRRRPRIIARAG